MKLKFTITTLLLTALSFGQTTWNNEFNDTSIDGGFKEIKVAPSNNLFAVGGQLNSGGLIYFYDGNNWTEIADSDMGNSSSIKSIAPISDTEYYTVSSKRDVHYYDGTDWTDISADLPLYNSNENFDVRFLYKTISFSADNVYVVGLFSNSIEGNQLYVAHFDGSSWSQVDVPQSNLIDSDIFGDTIEIDATDADDIWIAKRGYFTISGDYELGIWHFDGTNWTFEGENITSFGNVTLRDVDAFAADDVWFTGSVFNNSTGVSDAAYIHYDGSDYTLYTETGSSLAVERYCIAKLDDNKVWSGNESWDPSQEFTFFDGSSWSSQTTTLLTSLSGAVWDIKKLNDCLYAVGSSDNNDHPLILKTCSTLSVDDITNTLNQFSFYPNPTTNEIRLVNYQDLDKLYIYDLNGKQVFYTSSITQKVQVQNLNSGVYLIKVIDKNGNQQTKRMLKR